MDGATQAELAELRRRAFGLHPDIEADLDATARLVELEQLVLAEHAASVSAATGQPGAAEGADSSAWAAQGGPVSTIEPASGAADPGPASRAAHPGPRADAVIRRRPARARRRDGWVWAAAAALVAAGVVVATPATPPVPADGGVTVGSAESDPDFTRRSDFRMLLEIPFGPWIDTARPDTEVTWLFPASGEIAWTVPLGNYYGWDIWIAGTDDVVQKEHCILASHGGVAKARCMPAALRPYSPLVVTLPYQLVEPDERPPGFEPGELIGFWWRGDDSVTVLIAPARD
jgi:hypothetical protein